jgi:hypothetical protein
MGGKAARSGLHPGDAALAGAAIVAMAMMISPIQSPRLRRILLPPE